MPVFVHHDLRLLSPSFDSPLVANLVELEHLRRLQLEGTTPVPIFFQMKEIFHMAESVGSARIEGNHTTLADYVEHRVRGEADGSDQLREIENIERAMDYIEAEIRPGSEMPEAFIRELHHLTVSDLEREGDRTPGAYRTGGVRINQAEHLPPDPAAVRSYMEELVQFINRPDPERYHLMKVALAHHRFGWIHPFSNGNGRVVRLLTYALMIKYGFNVHGANRILNPTAVFCNDREQYYAMLGRADRGDDEGLEIWCAYVLSGVLQELQKVGQLTDYNYVRPKILEPAIKSAMERHLITAMEHQVLLTSLRAPQGLVKSKDLSDAMRGLESHQRTYQIRRLVDRNMLVPVEPGARTYHAGFANSYLLRSVMHALRDEGFLPERS